MPETLTIPFRCSLDAIILSMDIESGSREHKIVTEIGVSTLDTRHIKDCSTDAGLYEWLSTLQCTHLRIEEGGKKIARITDKKGTALWAGRKFNFGRSTWIRLSEAPHALKDVFCVPDNSSSSASEPVKYRNVIVIGHAWDNEDKYLGTLGDACILKSFGTVVAVVDIQTLHREGKNPPSLPTLCGYIGVDVEAQHNAGNDAAYTMVGALGNEIDRFIKEGFVESAAGYGAAWSIVHGLQEKGKAIQEAVPLDPYRCDNCGMINHATDDCHSFQQCTACGNMGHPRKICRWSTCEECEVFGHIKEKCPKLLRQRVRTTRPGQSRSSLAATQAMAEARKANLSTDLADTASFPTLATAITKSVTVQTSAVAALDTEKLVITTTVTEVTETDLLTKRGPPAKKKGKRFQKVDLQKLLS